jgi:hypothetical protein
MDGSRSYANLLIVAANLQNQPFKSSRKSVDALQQWLEH